MRNREKCTFVPPCPGHGSRLRIESVADADFVVPLVERCGGELVILLLDAAVHKEEPSAAESVHFSHFQLGSLTLVFL